jgi:hypothetical protein
MTDDWQRQLQERTRTLARRNEWDDDEEIVDSDERATARERVQDVVTMTPEVAAAVVAQPRVWVNPYDALLDEVRRTNAYVVLLGIEVDKYDQEHGGAHKYRTSRGTLARYERERDRLITVCSKAIGLGIAERQVRVAEREGELLAKMTVMALDAGGITEDQKKKILTALAEQLRRGSVPAVAIDA